MRNRIILIILLLTLACKGYAQNDFGVSLGMGLPELIHAGIRYELPPLKFGAAVGTAFTGIYSISGDVYYHFGGNPKFGDLSPWYLRGNITWWPFGKIVFIDLGEAVLLGFRIGREFGITELIGVSIDGGIIPFSFFSGKRIPFSFIPSVGVTVHYRLQQITR